MVSERLARLPLFRFDIFETDTEPCMQTVAPALVEGERAARPSRVPFARFEKFVRAS
jgi:hypothetical protein